MYKYNSYIWPSFSFLDKSLQSFGFFKKQLCTLLAPLLLLFLYFIDFLLISLLFCPFLCAIFVLCLTFKSGLVHSVFSPFQMFQATSFSCDSSCKMCQGVSHSWSSSGSGLLHSQNRKDLLPAMMSQRQGQMNRSS